MKSKYIDLEFEMKKKFNKRDFKFIEEMHGYIDVNKCQCMMIEEDQCKSIKRMLD
jgi:hypothetical protein